MSWKRQLKGDSISWLLETDSPGVRYLALRDLLDLSDEDSQLRSARRAAHKEGPIAAVLSRMSADGYWVKPGSGYSPNIKEPSGRSSCLPSWARAPAKTSASRWPADTIWIKRSRKAVRSAARERPPARPTACRGICAGR
jgi:hypothetical protein